MVREYLNEQRKKKEAGEDISQAKIEDQAYKDSLSYALGVKLGMNTLQQNFGTLNHAAVNKGFDDGYAGNGLVQEENVSGILNKHKIELKKIAKMKNKEEGLAFLTENKKKSGITETASGLQYEVIEASEGEKPLATDEVTVHYTGTLLDGTKFDSSVDRGEPTTFPLNRVIPGWTEGVQLMSEGSKFRFYIPSELAYGERGAGADIGPNSTLIFDVELLKIMKKEPPMPSKMGPSEAPDFTSFEENGARADVETTDSGLQYRVIVAADGAKPNATDEVTVHYTGMLTDGTKFDSSLDRGQPATFPLNRVIKGWTEGVALMSPGAIYRFYIPSSLGYGAQGAGDRIPPNSTLIFDVELLKIN
ncbi:MAG: FKBP-type peptidyl-prolyl cis-trans isomerase [Flavobacteriales bacterium]|nr:FKBP-type peptidyl-prolyl cis-trans isomerase [Flavobacteriales bacterium]